MPPQCSSFFPDAPRLGIPVTGPACTEEGETRPDRSGEKGRAGLVSTGFAFCGVANHRGQRLTAE